MICPSVRIGTRDEDYTVDYTASAPRSTAGIQDGTLVLGWHGSRPNFAAMVICDL